METILSFDLKADFGFFRKPETNNTINLSYNIIHRPAILGLLGAIAGLKGYEQKDVMPEYYDILKDIKIGVQPLSHDKGNYLKTNIKYTNTIGYANKGSNFLTEELTLINPSYRIFLLLNLNNEWHEKLYKYIKEGKAEYIPYFGKNEFSAWWEKSSVREFAFSPNCDTNEAVKISTVFIKTLLIKDNSEAPYSDFGSEIENPFIYFERLPKDFDMALMQYDLQEFAYSSFLIKNAQELKNLFFLKDEDTYVQLL